ncbi:hypothetical protein BDK51DRAFT_47688, partial [Blyttiomyces helicus]
TILPPLPSPVPRSSHSPKGVEDRPARHLASDGLVSECRDALALLERGVEGADGDDHAGGLESRGRPDVPREANAIAILFMGGGRGEESSEGVQGLMDGEHGSGGALFGVCRTSISSKVFMDVFFVWEPGMGRGQRTTDCDEDEKVEGLRRPRLPRRRKSIRRVAKSLHAARQTPNASADHPETLVNASVTSLEASDLCHDGGLYGGVSCEETLDAGRNYCALSGASKVDASCSWCY